VVTTRAGRKVVLLLGCLVLLCPAVSAEEVGPPRDVDKWHEALATAIGSEITEPLHRGWSLGIYPSAGIALGPYEWIAFQAHGYLSVSNGKSFSLFGGYGYERGPSSETHMATLGWGGVRRLSGARPQRGFYGKFLRYRKIRDFTHGVHHGLSVGAETGAGLFALAFEFGAARSNQNHWAITAQIGLKIAVPIFIPLSRDPGTAPVD
jgi:hypothetical protein